MQACEEADSESRFISPRERQLAARPSPALAPQGLTAVERFLAERAGNLAGGLTERWPALAHALWLARVPVGAPVVVLLALSAGLALDRLGDVRRINLLAFPLLGLIVWNLAIYATLLVRGPIRSRSRRVRGLALGAVRAAIWLGSPARWWARPKSVEVAQWLADALRRFLRAWLISAGSLVHARSARLLHFGAGAFAGGAVLGMYLRGLAFEYRAGWESTFLGAPAVARLLTVVLGPAAWIAHALAPGIAPAPERLFSVDMLERLRGPQADGEAAIWIHLWALTAVLAVIAPRLVLAWAAGRRAQRLAADLAPPLDDPYYLRLLAPARGAGAQVEVLPYSYRPTTVQIEQLRSLLLDLLGSQVHIRVSEAVGYGEEPPAPPIAQAGESMRIAVVLFNLAQSPEREVHGEYLEAVRRVIGTAADARLLVLLDEEAYRARIGGEAARIAERRRAWQRLVEEHGLVAVPFAPGPGRSDDALLASLQAALRPAAARPGAP